MGLNVYDIGADISTDIRVGICVRTTSSRDGRRGSPRNQAVAQPSTGPMQTYLGRGFGDVEFRGNLAMTQAMDVAQDDYPTQPFWQIVKCPSKTNTYCVVLECEFWIVCFTTICQIDHAIDVIVTRVALSAPHKGRRTICGDPMQPCREPGVATKLLQAAERPNIGVLHNVVGVVFVTRQAQRQAVHLLVGGLDQFIERATIALFRPCDQFFQVIFHAPQPYRAWLTCPAAACNPTGPGLDDMTVGLAAERQSHTFQDPYI